MLQALIACLLASAPPAEMVIHVDTRTHSVSPDLYGVFFEEINQAGEGGLISQLLRNPNFEESMDGSELGAGWTFDAGIQLVRERPRTWGKGVVADIPALNAPLELRNRGVFGGGFAVNAGMKYHAAVEARLKHAGAGTIHVELAQGGKTLASQDVTVGSTNWATSNVVLVPEMAADGCELRLVVRGSDIQIDGIWMTPESDEKTFRPDLAAMVSGLKPAFVRFPGGCFVEGGDKLADAFRWKETLGPPSERKGHRNTTWGYWCTDLLGFHEYLEWCERLGAQPMYVANCGLSHQEVVVMKDLQPWIQECLDAIEYANGSVETVWGKARAAAGHPEPFHLKYVEIGNENGMFGNSFGGTKAQYTERYKAFFEAIKGVHPEIVTIANTPIEAPMEVIDEHYYQSPQWFWDNVDRYDTYSRHGAKIYVGEYAVTQGCGLGNLAAALGEAAFMTGMERNSDWVVMSSYAPMFTHGEHRKWNPDMIVFDEKRVFGTPSYYVQQLFAQHRPDVVVRTEVPLIEESASLRGSIGLGTWKTHAEFKDIVVMAPGKADGVYASDFGRHADGWRFDSGRWERVKGALQQLDDGEMKLAVLDLPEMRTASEYSVTLKARKIAGEEGFLIAFRATNADNLIFWNIGGWNNKEAAFEMVSEGSKSGLGPHVPSQIETGKWYTIRLDVNGESFRGYMDGVLVQEATQRKSRTFAGVAGIVDQSNELVVKAVNRSSQPQQMTLRLDSKRGCETTGRKWTLTSGSLNDENSLEAPRKVAVVEDTFDLTSGEITFPARSLTVLRLKLHR